MKTIRFLSTAASLVVLLCCFSSSLPAATPDPGNPYGKYTPPEDRAEFDYDSSGDVPWQEQQDAIPAPPEDDALTQVDIDHPPIGFKIYIADGSVSVGEKDSIIRYWLVMKAGKSRNAMYEGVRCNTHEYKTYAYANKWKKGKINKVRDAQWVFISGEIQNHYRHELEKYYFCAGPLPRKVADIRASLHGSHSERNAYDELINQ